MLTNPRYDHCTVQIDDCRAAVIGGTADGTTNVSPLIEVYNFEDHAWEDGPE